MTSKKYKAKQKKKFRTYLEKENGKEYADHYIKDVEKNKILVLDDALIHVLESAINRNKLKVQEILKEKGVNY